MSKPQVLELPKANFPVCNRVVASAPFPDEKTGRDIIITWKIGEQHPHVDEFTVVRMYVIAGQGVEVYSKNKDGSVGTRNTLPWHRCHMVEELMDPRSFVEEILRAEEEAQGGGDEPEPQPKNGAASADVGA